jgi:flagellin
VSELVSTSNGYDLALDFSTSANAATTLNNVDQKIDQLATMRTTFGSVQSVLASEGSNLASSRLAISASLSRIEDVDYANEVTQLARNKILENSGVAVSAQANAESSRLLRRLLTGAMA